jgi:hypothetical protein
VGSKSIGSLLGTAPHLSFGWLLRQCKWSSEPCENHFSTPVLN